MTLSARSQRLPFLAGGILALAYGVWVGLARLGWPLPLLQPAHLTLHGPLMVCGFLGAIIGLERAVAVGAAWSYLAPALAVLGTLTCVVSPGSATGPALFGLSSLLLVAVYAWVLKRQPTLFTGVMAAGATLWLVGNLLWLAGMPLPRLALLWAAFLVLTIAGERLELTRFLKPTRFGRVTFLLATVLVVVGALSIPLAASVGQRLSGAGLVALALWLARYDIARRTVREQGLTRFVALALLSGYAWLAVSGLLTLALAGRLAGPVYDATLHALFLGFVFAMIFGHAPIIFPAVLRGSLAFRPAFYLHLALLHASLLARVGGDLLLVQAGEPWLPWRLWGGVLNGAAVALFLVNTLSALRLGPVAGRPSPP